MITPPDKSPRVFKRDHRRAALSSCPPLTWTGSRWSFARNWRKQVQQWIILADKVLGKRRRWRGINHAA